MKSEKDNKKRNLPKLLVQFQPKKNLNYLTSRSRKMMRISYYKMKEQKYRKNKVLEGLDLRIKKKSQRRLVLMRVA
jgi:hypothetical protein